MRRRIAAVSITALWLWAALASAEVVEGLYSAQVPVTDQSSASLASASRDALGQVLVKVSGSAEALDNPVVKKELANARSHVQQYAFSRGMGADDALTARFEFDSSYVTRLVTRAQLPLWTANRPRVLAWMAVEQDGQRQFVSLDATPELAQELLLEFEQRGVPAQLPLFDLADATAISVEDVWNLDGGTAQAASARYDVEDVLIGRVVAMSTGEWLGDWSYISGRHRLDRNASAPESRGFSQQGVALVAEEMAARYAVAPTGGGDDLVVMTISGVQDFADYAEIVNWLEGLELIDHANVRQITGDRVELGLVSLAEADALAKIIELNEHLQPQASLPGQLDYAWLN